MALKEDHECQQSAVLDRIEKGVEDGRKEQSETLREMIKLMGPIARQEEAISSIREGLGRHDKYFDEIFKRLWVVENAPGKQAQEEILQHANHERQSVSGLKIALISSSCALLVAMIQAYINKRY